MLGYPICFTDGMVSENLQYRSANRPTLRSILYLIALVPNFGNGAPLVAQQGPKISGKGGVAELSSSGPQSHSGSVTSADGEVDLRYGNERLRADHVEYNDQTNEGVARGHVQFDYENQHLEAEEAHYNVSTGRGTFVKVRGTIKIERRSNPAVLITENPLSFEAQSVEKFGENLYLINDAWITVCDPEHPRWQFFAPRARVQ